MKKILQVNITCGRGSTGKLAQILYCKSQEFGYEARFAYSAYTPTIADAFRIETKLQNIIRRGLNKYIGRKQRHSNAGTKRLIKYIEREKPSLIHLHNIQQNSVNYIMLFEYLKRTNIPTVYTIHDCFPITGGCFGFKEYECEQYKSGCLNCMMKVHPDDITKASSEAYRIKQKLIGENDNIYPVCVSDWLRSCAVSSYMGRMSNAAITIHNGISTNNFSPKASNIRAQYGISPNAFVILGVASYWTVQKGLDLMMGLSKMIPDNTVMVLVGAGANQIDSKNVVCIDYVDGQEKLARLYSAADVYLSTSMQETFGLTIAEAMACGTPSIVMNSTACPEIVDEATGIVVERDCNQILEAIMTVMKNGKETYSSSCVKRAKDCFDENRMAEQYCELYRSILNG